MAKNGAKIGAEMRTIQEKIESNQKNVHKGQEEMTAQMGSLASQMNANQEEMKDMLQARTETSQEPWKVLMEIGLVTMETFLAKNKVNQKKK